MGAAGTGPLAADQHARPGLVGPGRGRGPRRRRQDGDQPALRHLVRAAGEAPRASTPDGPAVARLVKLASLENKQCVVNIDVVGVGSSPYDFCRHAGISNLHPINFAEGTDRRDRSGQLEFYNVRAFAYWRLREALDPSGTEQIALPPDPELLADLTAARWEMTPQGVKIEKKVDIAKRIGRSPDCADACVLANFPSAPFEVGTPPTGHGNAIDRLPADVFGGAGGGQATASGAGPESIWGAGGLGGGAGGMPAW